MKSFSTLLISFGFIFLTLFANGCSGGSSSSEDVDASNGVVLAEDLDSAQYLTQDSNYVYFTQSGDGLNGTLNRVPVAGEQMEVLATGLNNPTDIASDSKYIYWIEDSEEGTIKRTPLGGGEAITLAEDLNSPRSLIIYENYLYWCDKDDGDGMIRRVSVDGGAVSDIYATRITPWGIATDGLYVFFTEAYDSPSGRVLKVSVNGGSAITLVDGLGAPFSVALDGTYVYWMEFGWEQKLGKTKMDGSSTVILSMNNSYSWNPKILAIDDENAYFGVQGGVDDTYGAIQKVSINGGGVTTVVKTGEYSRPYSLTLDDDYIYWAQSDAVKKISKSATDKPPVVSDGSFSGDWIGTYEKTSVFETYSVCTDIQRGTIELNLNTLNDSVTGSSSSSNVTVQKDPDSACPPPVAQAFSDAPFQGALTSPTTLDGPGKFLVSDCDQLSAQISADVMSGTCVGSVKQIGVGYSDSYVYTWSVTRF